MAGKLHLDEVEARHIRELHQSLFFGGCNANSVIERYLISKESLATFLSSKEGKDIVQTSELHGDVIAQFIEKQKNSDMEFTMSL